MFCVIMSITHVSTLLRWDVKMVQLLSAHIVGPIDSSLSNAEATVKPKCCTWPARGRFYNKIDGTVLSNIHRIELFSACCKYWGHLTTLATAFDFCRRTALRMLSCQCEQKIAGVATAFGDKLLQTLCSYNQILPESIFTLVPTY